MDVIGPNRLDCFVHLRLSAVRTVNQPRDFRLKDRIEVERHESNVTVAIGELTRRSRPADHPANHVADPILVHFEPRSGMVDECLAHEGGDDDVAEVTGRLVWARFEKRVNRTGWMLP